MILLEFECGFMADNVTGDGGPLSKLIFGVDVNWFITFLKYELTVKERK